MESASVAVGGAGDPAAEGSGGDKGLKSNAIGYLSNLVISTASVAPAYSLAATLGFVVAVQGVGLAAPAVMIVSFIPMLLIAGGYYYMNKADPDCGTSFTWVTRALGPRLGWLTGWSIVAADIVVMATLAYIAGVYTFLLFGLDARRHQPARRLDRRRRMDRRDDLDLLRGHRALGAHPVRAAHDRDHHPGRVRDRRAGQGLRRRRPQLGRHPASWFNPFSIPSGALIDGVLLGVFIYWGWDSGVCCNEESEDSASGPGKAAVVSTLLLVLIYVVVSASAQAFAGEHYLIHHHNDVLGALGTKVFGSPLDKLLIITVLTSASASTQTTILPTARTTLSMARFGAIPKVFGRIHPRYLTPDASTLTMGVVSLIWTLFIINVSQDVLGDSITGLGFQIAFYYGLTGFACAIYYRKELFKSARNFLLVGVAPFLGGLMLLGIFIKALTFYQDPVQNYSGGFLGVGTSVAVGIGLLLLGVVVMIWANFVYPRFFARKAEVVDPRILTGEITGTASVMAD